MKAKRKDADKARQPRRPALDALQAKLDGKEAEHTAAQAAGARPRAAALAKANDRILKSEVKAAAKGVLADPAGRLQVPRPRLVRGRATTETLTRTRSRPRSQTS